MFLKYSAEGTSPVPSAHLWVFFRISTCYKSGENELGFERLVIVWGRYPVWGTNTGKMKMVKDWIL